MDKPEEILAKIGPNLADKNEDKIWSDIAYALKKTQKPGRIEVTPEEKRKAEAILNVFQPYIDSHYFFDIMFSRKFGFVRMDFDGIINQYSTADELMDCLINELSLDVRGLKLEGEHMTTAMSPVEEAELRSRISPLIDKLSDCEHYSQILEDYISAYRQQ